MPGIAGHDDAAVRSRYPGDLQIERRDWVPLAFAIRSDSPCHSSGGLIEGEHADAG